MIVIILHIILYPFVVFSVTEKASFQIFTVFNVFQDFVVVVVALDHF